MQPFVSEIINGKSIGLTNIKFSKCCGKYMTRKNKLVEKRIDVVGKYKEYGNLICSRCGKSASEI